MVERKLIFSGKYIGLFVNIWAWHYIAKSMLASKLLTAHMFLDLSTVIFYILNFSSLFNMLYTEFHLSIY